MSMPNMPKAAYTCPYCRMASEGQAGPCPTLRRAGRRSGGALRSWIGGRAAPDTTTWPASASASPCTDSGTYVPVAEMGLHDDDWSTFPQGVP